ncbi:signal peptidase I [Ectothiorhodospiraceae bacterium 2226]|nr:signal peptidase I [Ectothiorhodospiraceae bacterium 2226]
MDFALLLVLAALITGGIWLVDVLFFAPRRQGAAVAAGDGRPASLPAKEPVIVEYARSFFPVIVIVLLLRSFLAEPFRIPSGSMMPTLLVGDFILVNKFSYGIRLPVLNTKVIGVGEPQRGDVIVFRYPEDPRVDYIKRVVAVPGDHVAYQDKVLYVNGEEVGQQPLSTYIGSGAGAVMTGASLREERLREPPHQILVRSGAASLDQEWQIPAGEYFVMGDNRDNSKDSRYWGTVPEDHLVGKAFLIWMNWDPANGGIAWGRIGNAIE